MKSFFSKFRDHIDVTDGTVVIDEETYKAIQADAMESVECSLSLTGGVELSGVEGVQALDAAMKIIQSIGTTGIYERYRDAEKWMAKYYPNWT